MSIQSDFQAAGDEYARRIEQQREAERLEALRLEARKHSSASAFAEFFEAALAEHDSTDTDDDSTDTQENQ